MPEINELYLSHASVKQVDEATQAPWMPPGIGDNPAYFEAAFDISFALRDQGVSVANRLTLAVAIPTPAAPPYSELERTAARALAPMLQSLAAALQDQFPDGPA